MSIKEMSHACCSGMGAKHKKIFILISGVVVLAIVVLLIAAIGWKIHEARNGGNMMYGQRDDFGRGQMMNQGKGLSSSADNQFVLPGDALKSGELAIVVNDLEIAKKAVSDVAAKSNGSVYATFIAYASKNMKNGSIVVQIPVEKFDATFGDLKKVGQQVVQESTQQVAPRGNYPVPMGATVQSSAEATSSPEIAMYPNPAQIQSVQDKGYIRVIFVDYGNGLAVKKQAVANSIISIGGAANQDMRNNLLVIVGVKLILLIAIFGLLFVIFKKIFHKVRRRKEHKHVAHIVRQMPKTRARIVKTQKKKKK